LAANFNRFRQSRKAAIDPVSGGFWPSGAARLRQSAAIRERAMAKAYYSTVFEQPAAEVWKIIRDFNNYSIWVQGEGFSEIEDGKSGDTVGAVRSVHFRGMHIRQRLLAHSDVERSQTYEFCGAPALPVTDYQSTIRVTPIVDGERAFVEWSATFDCDAGGRSELTATLAGSFEKWLESLRDIMAG